MAENVKKNDAEGYPVTTGIIGEIKKWYWALLLIISLSATIFYAAAKMTYKPVYQSYASLTLSYRDGTTAEKIEDIAKELMAKAQDGSLAAALASEDSRDADIRFVADGINLAVSVRASSPEVSYGTLRSITEKGVELLDEKPDYTLVLTDDSGMPNAVTNPLDTNAEAMRGLLVGAVLVIVFLIFRLVMDKKKAAKASAGAEVKAEPEPVKPASRAEVKAESEPVKPVRPAAPEAAAAPEPVKPVVEKVIEPVAGKVIEPVAKEVIEPVVEEIPEPAPVRPEEAPYEEPKTAGGIPADLAMFASTLGAMSFDIPAVSETAPAKEAEKPAEEELLKEEPILEEEAETQEEKVPENEISEEVPADNSADEEEWDPEKTSLSKEMWEIAKEMGMLDDFRI